MTLEEWTRGRWGRVTLDRRHVDVSGINGARVTVETNPLDIELTEALLSTAGKREFARLAVALLAERAGETVTERLSDGTYSLLLAKARHALTDRLLRTDNQMYRKWLDILERRDPAGWAPRRSVKADVPPGGTRPVSITFEVV